VKSQLNTESGSAYTSHTRRHRCMSFYSKNNEENTLKYKYYTMEKKNYLASHLLSVFAHNYNNITTCNNS